MSHPHEYLLAAVAVLEDLRLPATVSDIALLILLTRDVPVLAPTVVAFELAVADQAATLESNGLLCWEQPRGYSPASRYYDRSFAQAGDFAALLQRTAELAALLPLDGERRQRYRNVLYALRTLQAGRAVVSPERLVHELACAGKVFFPPSDEQRAALAHALGIAGILAAKLSLAWYQA